MKVTLPTLLLSSFIGLSAHCAQANDSPTTVKLALHDWTGHHISTRIMGEVLKRSGLAVEYIETDYMTVPERLKKGEVHISMEIWETSPPKDFETYRSQSHIEKLGEMGVSAIEEWWYPEYMKALCPGLPDWRALKQCAKAFATSTTSPKGRYLSGPEQWGGNDQARIAALGLDFEVEYAESDAALFVALKEAYQQQAPIMLWVYAPHWAPVTYQGEWVEFPAHHPNCELDPAWGINPEATFDCGKPRGSIWKVAWSGLQAHSPKAHSAVQNFYLDSFEIGNMIAEVDLEQQKVEDVVARWMDNNQPLWEAWLP